MGPKKTKENDDSYWRTRIEDALLNDDQWTVEVVMIEAAGNEQDRIYLSKFEIFAAEEKRFVIKSICKTETIFMINQLGTEKKIKDDNLRVFEEGNSYLRDKKDIPPDILALIIKHLILKMKDEYLFIKRQKLEVKEGIRRESATMINRAEVRGTISVKPPDPPTPVKGKSKKGDTDPLIPEPNEGKKYNTTLRLRGEEWRDKVYVDDFPTDGPNLYVAITGFVDPILARCLTMIGIPLMAIVQIRIELASMQIPSTLIKATKRGQSQTELQAERSLKFWEDLQQLRLHQDSTNDFKNTAFIIFSPPYSKSASLSGSPDKIYDEMCYLLYDIQDLKRQHGHFIDNMDIIQIPYDQFDEKQKNIYNHQIDDIPLECITTYSILDGILQAVCKSEEVEESASKSSVSDNVITKPSVLNNLTTKSSRNYKADDKEEVAQNFVQEVFNTLCKTDADRKAYRVTYGEEQENIKDPIVINFGDLAKYSTFHLGNINLDNIIWSTLFGMPINRLWLKQDMPTEVLEAKINFHVNVLLSCFERSDVETAELNRLIHILAFRKLYNNRSSLKKHHLQSMTINEFKKIYLKRSILAEPLPKSPSIYQCSSSASPSFPSITKSENASYNLSQGEISEDSEERCIKFLFDCPDISELVSAAEIANRQPINHMIDNFEFFEDFHGTKAFQILLDAFNKFNCVDYKYCEVTDCLVLMVFNSHDKDGIAREEWRSHLPTPLCLQDFFDYVLEEHYSWIQNEEKIYDEKMTNTSQSYCNDAIDPFAAPSCLQDTDIEMELLMEGSLKYQEIAQIEESTIDVASIKPEKKNKASSASTDIDSKSSRKIKSPALTPKTIKHSMVALSSDSSIHIPKKPFSGYDLGDRRVEVFGKDSTFFSKDGTRVSSLYTLLIPMNLEYIVLNVLPGCGDIEFYLHKALGEFVTQDILDACESFRINSKDQVMINLKKNSFQSLPLISPQTNENSKIKDSTPNTKTTSIKSGPTFPKLREVEYSYSVHVTWPNGLITESVYENKSSVLSHIKQYYTSNDKPLDEKMRCISLNGEVIIFKTSGDIEVLRPEGTYFTITKCDLRPVVPLGSEDLRSDASSDKSKKGKSKEKLRDKPSKAPSKISKASFNNDDEERQPLEYELYIEEFEMIDQLGLRQIWANDKYTEIERLLVRTATDHILGEVFSRKMGGTYNLLKNGVQMFTFRDKTRIISEYFIEKEEIFPEWTDEEKEYFDMLGSDSMETETNKSKISVSQKSYVFNGSAVSSTSKKLEEEETKEKVKERTDGFVSIKMIYTIEHAHLTTVTIDTVVDKVYIDSPNSTRIVIDSNNHYDITLNNETSAKFNGEVLNIKYEACTKCRSFTSCDIMIKESEDKSCTDLDNSYWLKMRDSFCKKIIVNPEGNMTTLDEPYSHEKFHADGTPQEENVDAGDMKGDAKSEISVTSHGKCQDMYEAKTIRFFVLRR